MDWNVSRRPCATFLGVVKTHPRVGVPVYRTIMLRPKPRGLDDLRMLLLVLAHELVHVLGMRTGTFRWGHEHTFTQGVDTLSSDSEERVAEVGAELLMDRLGVAVRDPSWRQVLGDPSPEEVDLAVQRVAFLP